MISIDGQVFDASAGISAIYTVTGVELTGAIAFLFLKNRLTDADSAAALRAGSPGSGFTGVTASLSGSTMTLTVAIAPALLPSLGTATEKQLFFDLKLKPLAGNPLRVDAGKITIRRTAIATVP